MRTAADRVAPDTAGTAPAFRRGHCAAPERKDMKHKTPAPRAVPLAQYITRPGRGTLSLRMAISNAQQKLAKYRNELEQNDNPPPWRPWRLTPPARDALRRQIAEAEKDVAAAVADLHLWLRRQLVSGQSQIVARSGPAMPLEPVPREACVGIRFGHPTRDAAALDDGTVLFDVHVAPSAAKGAPAEQAASSPPAKTGPEPKGKRGPKGRRTAPADRALFDELEAKMRGKGLSPTAAAIELAEEGKVTGGGSADSRGKRLARLYLHERPTEMR
jgi:hypothetical protein